MTEQVLIEFVSDTSGLQSSIDKLEALGVIDQKVATAFKQSNTELTKRSQQLNAIGSNTSKLASENNKVKKSITDLDASVKGFANNFIQGFQEGVIDELKKAGVSTKEFQDALKKTGKTGVETTTTLKAELRGLVEQMSRLKAEGNDNTEQYEKLRQQAGKLRDAIGDVNAEINRTASDTRKLDTVIEFGQGIAASFAVAQGAAALFGKDSEELQETLVKVTSAIAILNGLQTVGNLLQKESNLIRTISIAQLKLQNIQTNLQVAAQSKNIVVSGAANVAMKILNVTMRANPALLLVSAFAALAGALYLFSKRTKDAEYQTQLLNVELSRQNDLLKGNVDKIDFQTKLELASAKTRGATEKELNDITINGLQRTEREYKNSLQRRVSVAKDLFPELGEIVIKNEADAQAALRRVERFEAGIGKNIDKEFKQRLDNGKEILRNAISDFQGLAQTQQEIKLTGVDFDADQAEKLRQKQKESADKRRQDLEKQFEEEKKLRHKGFEDFVALTEVQLLASEKGSEQELNLQKRKLRATLQLNLDNEDLTQNQRLLLVKQYFKDVEDLEKGFYKERSRIQIENTISTLNAELNALNITADEKAKLTTELLNKQRELELSEVAGNKAKEKEINAKFDKEIADQSVAIFKTALDEEERLLKSRSGPQLRKDAKAADDPNVDITERIDAIDRLKNFELESIQKRKDQNQKFLDDGIISQKEFELNAADFADQEAQAVENAEDKKRNAYKQTADKRKELEKAQIELVIQTAQQSIEIIGQFLQQQSEAALIDIDSKKRRVDELRTAGAITEKESIARMKKLEAEEKRIKREQAKRDRDVAIFQAVINTADAVIKAYATTGPIAGSILAGIVAAIGAAQIALIASRPIPKFFKGKKDGYQGWGEVGDRGSELIETNGKLFVAEKPTVMWLNKKDIVYTHEETKRILEKPIPRVERKVMAFSNSMNNQFSIDYKKIGAEVGKHVINNHLEITEKGISETSRQGNSWTEYLDRRRRFG